MLKSIFGCRSVEKILLFLLVNEKCYATQLHRMLQTPLTPIQKALDRLEKGEVLTSHFEGKNRIFQFNPSYPLLNELEMLLKRAFQQIPLQEKKSYYYLKSEKNEERKESHELLQTIWDHLKSVTRVTLVTRSCSKRTTGNNWKGKGKVFVKEDAQTIIFTEQGSWKGEKKQGHNYTNSFRWKWDRQEGKISLEHLRFGEKNPVFLFHLVPTAQNLLESSHSHICGDDSYFGILQYTDLFLQLHFRTLGPKKNEVIEYIYT